MKFLIIREKKRRQSYAKIETHIFALKYILNNTNLSLRIRWYAAIRISALTKKISICSLNNRCFITGRKASYIRHFKMSRIKVRQHALNQNLLAVSKFSW